MPGSKRFNIRVYGIWMREGQILVNEELIRGESIVKFPGGGMEWGEGTIECLKREWQEEFGIDIEVTDHFYTTDYFQPSAYDDSQVVSIYYWVDSQAHPAKIVNQQEGDKAYWLPIQDIEFDTFPLPIDRIVGNMLCKLFGTAK